MGGSIPSHLSNYGFVFIADLQFIEILKLTADCTFNLSIIIIEIKLSEAIFPWDYYEHQILIRTDFYNFNDEEFDPGSGWTLAAGLTHASRGAARE